jgi:hypothetical protein
MFKRRFIFLFGFIALLMFGFGRRNDSVANYQAGWQQGFVAGQQASTPVETAPSAPVAPSANDGQAPAYQGYDSRGYHGVSLIGGMFRFWLMFILIGFIFNMMRFGRRGGMGGWHKPHHHSSDKDDNVPYEKQPEDIDNGIDPTIRHA